MRPVRRRVHAWSILVVAVTAAAFAAVGFLAGRTSRPTIADAASAHAGAAGAGYAQGEASMYPVSWHNAYRRGWAAGVRAAKATAAADGRAAGRAEAARRTASTEAASLTAALTIAPAAVTKQTKTEKCVPLSNGLCEALGPGATGKPCPAGSTPNIPGGVVCIPRVLIVATHVAEQASVEPVEP